ncbi:MAG: 16S rRNA (adenine(1518)-N(6)/adenine(1519)-N(6))-dimethyltransferase RsmA [Lactobacillales bacterium]|jgi:16S rRNA (adenine1518-N6/adenine1519-N6)-dimethyltransferase|nr:16S rRNA (adenine(1518)-N(6)/adenine(1519)-N(6))-dimethyltransferase RsmA [Lactobacillales bacterium]
MAERDLRDIANPTRTREIIKKYGFNFKKKFGQNFLTEPNILKNIVTAAGVNDQVNVLEVGPGIGALTEYLAREAAEVVAFEIDKTLLPILGETLEPYDNVTIVNQDVLKLMVNEIPGLFENPDLPIKVVANLPYYITTPIIMHFLEHHAPIDEMVVMMQKEVGERLDAKPSTKEYGNLSIAVQYYTTTNLEFIVPKTVFVPQPNVDSAIVKLTVRKTPPVEVKDEKEFFKIIKAAFMMRRKTLWNNLTRIYDKEMLAKALEQSGIEPNRRGESLSIEEFASLANNIISL